MKRMATVSYSRPDELTGHAALKVLSGWLSGGLKLDGEKHGFWLMYELLTGGLQFKLLDEDETHELGALMVRHAAPAGGAELLYLLRLLEAEPALAAAMPRFAGAARKGPMKLFKGKTGKGMPDEVFSALQRLLQQLPQSGVPGYPLYSPPSEIAMPPLRQVRLNHRTWLAPRALGCSLDTRPVPQTFADEADDPQGALVLHAIDALSFTAQSKTSADKDVSRLPQLALEGHACARTVVAAKMLQRLNQDSQWLAQELSAGSGRALGFRGVEGGAAAAAQIAAVEAVIEALRQVHEADDMAQAQWVPWLLQTAAEGGASASEVELRSRSLAQQSGTEPAVSLEVLSELVMAQGGVDELMVSSTDAQPHAFDFLDARARATAGAQPAAHGRGGGGAAAARDGRHAHRQPLGARLARARRRGPAATGAEAWRAGL